MNKNQAVEVLTDEHRTKFKTSLCLGEIRQVRSDAVEKEAIPLVTSVPVVTSEGRRREQRQVVRVSQWEEWRLP